MRARRKFVGDLVITVDVGNYKAVVHYSDCPYYQHSQKRQVPLRLSTKVRLCSYCDPSEEALRAAVPDVEWYPFCHSPGARTRIFTMEMERADAIAARRALGNGKTRTVNWS